MRTQRITSTHNRHQYPPAPGKSIQALLKIWPLLVVIAALFIAGCSVEKPPMAAVPDGARAGDLIGLEACAFQPPGSKSEFRADCGTLIVPENWDKTGSRLIALPVVRVQAGGPEPEEPVFFLQGGPGQSNISWEPPAWLLENHDVIFVGYRGIDGTITLECPEVTRALKNHIGKDLFSDPARAEYVAAVRQCADGYRSAGVDLPGYSVSGVIKDLEAARLALGYDRINLLSESYGTRVAQIYATMHPENLHRLVLVGVNTPGHFVWDRAALDSLIGRISDLCAQDAGCSDRTGSLAQTFYEVNRNMPERWLFFNIDPDTVRLGAHFMLLENPNMPMIFDAYLAAAEGDPSGLAMINLMTSLAPIDQQVFGDLTNKAGMLDLEKYQGIESVNLGDSIMGAPMAEWIWPLALEWPLELAAEEFREFQESEVEMLLINGTVDFSTPPTALDEARPYYHKAQMVLLPEFSHISDVMETLQPQAFERLITTFYDTGVADTSLYTYEPLPFQPGISLAAAARWLVAVIIIVPVLLILGLTWIVMRVRRRADAKLETADRSIPGSDVSLAA